MRTPTSTYVLQPYGEQATKCPVCLEVFKGESAYNAHKVGQYGVDRRCLLPPELPPNVTRWHWELKEGQYGTWWSKVKNEGEDDER